MSSVHTGGQEPVEPEAADHRAGVATSSVQHEHDGKISNIDAGRHREHPVDVGAPRG